MVISMLKIRRPLGRLIFNTGIAIPGKTVFLIETAPWSTIHRFKHFVNKQLLNSPEFDDQNETKIGKEWTIWLKF